VGYLKRENCIMITSLLLAVLSPYTALLPAAYMTYKVLLGKVTIYKNPWNIGLLLLFGWSLISGIINQSLISTVLSLAFLMYFCLSVFLQNYFYNESQIEKLYKYLVYFSIFPALLGIIEKIVFMNFDVAWWKTILGISNLSNINHRIYSTFGNPNVAGTWFATMILVCVYFATKTSKKEKLFYQVSMVLFAFTLFLTGSRGAEIGLLVGLVAYYSIQKNKKYMWYPIALFGILALISFIPSDILNINDIMGHEINSSFQSRDAIWDGCIKMFKLKPLAGWGLMGIYNQGLNYILYDTKIFHGHNIWITLLTTLGIVGLSIYLYMKFNLYMNIKTLYNQNCRLVPLLTGIQALVLGHGLVDFTIMTPQAGLLFISCSALISSLAMQVKTSEVKTTIPVVQYNPLSKIS
jgi:putative inorganic carbon (HCO3(-)) transporter